MNTSFLPSSAAFSSMDRGYYVDGTVRDGKIMPLRVQNHTTNPSAYTLNNDGTVTINQSGDYLISAKVQSYDKNDINADTYALQLNGSNYNATPDVTKSFTTYRGDNNEVGLTTVMHINADQKLSISQITTPRTYGGLGGGGLLGGGLLGGGLLGGMIGGRGSGKGGATLTTAPGGNPTPTPTLGLAITRVG
jgi:hypothetical protein